MHAVRSRKSNQEDLGQDVLAMADIEFERFVEPLRENLDQYKLAVSAKKSAGKKKEDEDIGMVEEEG
ncbi:unnamed protein product [Pieris macdunnoughi]|uniref:Uncharacterized protein n=1 Tax=Pieris macdunnoughi TaxID=345717 RepID=A0A821SNJ3_9NEOP|nr:unnamed protein product [Pieris macdunnoughi]